VNEVFVGRKHVNQKKAQLISFLGAVKEVKQTMLLEYREDCT